MELQAYLPPELRDATITRITQGLSGAGVYRVEAGDRIYVLKIGIDRAAIQRAAAAAGRGSATSAGSSARCAAASC